MSIGDVLSFIFNILNAWDGTPRITILVHEAFFQGINSEPFYFIKVCNLSPENICTITHVWIKDGKKEKDVVNPERPLPHKLKASEVWETWYPKKSIEDQDNIHRNVHVVMSNGKIYKSNKNPDVRPLGFVAK